MDDLYPYQVEGAQWLQTKRPKGKFWLLADPMGVGKTAQVIEAVNQSSVIHDVLVLCPAIARAHWFGEYVKFAKRPFNLTVRTFERTYEKGAGRIQPKADLLRPWDLLVIDESHYLNNPQTHRTRVAYLHVAPYAARVWCVSGTPARNHNGDLYTFLKAAGLTTLSHAAFCQHFCTVIPGDYGPRIVGSRNTDELRGILAPYVLRRRKEDVLPQLPPIRFSEYPVDPGPVDMARWFPDVYLGTTRLETMLNAVQEEHEAIEKMFSILGETDDAVQALAAFNSRTTKSRRYTELQKVEPVATIIREELMAGAYTKIVVFGWHNHAIEELAFQLRAFNPRKIYGGSSPRWRLAAERVFREDPDCHVFIGNIQAAGVAINLSVASEVALMGCSYVPTENAQAVMRVHRLPQQHPVHVRFFSIPNSTDQKVQRILKRKTKDLCALHDDRELVNPLEGVE